ncbi:MAG TPA: LysM peptidoglycan-binding domain-containing protein [Pseudolysinimonas sp.]|nr:LysM peptidoglycan-binding domain-containing protein [Pseudolysinimonas sp.]
MTSIAFGSTGPVRPRLRITRRGRAVLAVLMAIPLAAGALFAGFGAMGATATQTSGADGFSYVSVQPGESLWQLAETVAPNADPRDVVSDIVKLNDLGSGEIQPGQRIAIPAQYAQ